MDVPMRIGGAETHPRSHGRTIGTRIGQAIAASLCLAALSATSARAQSDETYVSNYTADTITVYARTTNGDIAPTRTIRTGLSRPHTLGIDYRNRELFVANNRVSDENPSITVYDLTASFPGNDTPKRTLQGPATGLNRPAGIAVDTVHQELYVTNDLDSGSFINVYPLGANGNVAPIRTLSGSATGIEGPIGIMVDLVHDELVISNYKVAGNGSITVFPRTANGNVAPLRTIQGAATGFDKPQGLAVDLAHDELIVANSFFFTASAGSILVFPRTASGNVAPIRQIGGPTSGVCNPIGLVFDAVHDEVAVSNSHASTASCPLTVATYARTANGDVPPIREIGPGPNSALSSSEGVAVATRVNCSDPSIVDGTPCDDGNACTPTDVCQAGVCVGSGSVVCVASDQCHVAGTCSPATGCSNPAKPNGTSCDDGNACTLSDSCQSGTCTGANPVVCSPADVCHLAGSCNPATGQCATGVAIQCSAIDQCHDAGTCDPVNGCSNPAKPDGTSCSDSNDCTQGDSCQLGACVGGSAICAAEELFVSNYSGNMITVYGRLTNGDVAPTRTIQTGLDRPHTLGIDLLHRELFVPNNHPAEEQPAIHVYDLAASYPSNDQPKRTIVGTTTGLDRPAGLAVDSVHQELYVANDLNSGSAVNVFALGASGDVAPIRTLSGAATGIEGPLGIAIDLVHDELVIVSYKVADGGSVTVFPRTANGNATPLRTIQGPSTGFSQPQGVGIDLAHDEIYVANSSFLTGGAGALLVFPRTATGNVAPTRQISGPNAMLCSPTGVVFDAVNNEIVVANADFGSNPCTETVTTFAQSAVDNASPVRLIGPGPNSLLAHPPSVAIKTHVNCADPAVANGTRCDDGNACTQGDTCQSGACVSGPAVTCSASDQCHDAGACNPATGVCSNPAKANGTACNDGVACTVNDTCSGGTCSGTAISCDDGNPCTTDSCGASGCLHTNNTAACDDGNACTSSDVCSGGLCAGTPITCNDNNPCTDDSCNPASGCVFANNTNACDDGSVCTTGDTCSGGRCTGAPISCNDGDPCTADSCNPVTGCVHTPLGAPEEIDDLVVNRPSKLQWSGAGSSAVYDVVTATISSLALAGTTTATCLANDLANPNYSDGRPAPPADGYYYLVRAQAICGTGSYGQDSTGTERSPILGCP